MYNLGLLLRDKGDYAGAEPLVWRALALEEKMLGPNTTGCASALETLASLRAAQGDSKGSEPLLRQALSVKEIIYKPDHPSLASTLANLAAMLEQKGAADEAENLHLRQGAAGR